MVGRWISFWEGLFLGAMLVSGSVFFFFQGVHSAGKYYISYLVSFQVFLKVCTKIHHYKTSHQKGTVFYIYLEDPEICMWILNFLKNSSLTKTGFSPKNQRFVRNPALLKTSEETPPAYPTTLPEASKIQSVMLKGSIEVWWGWSFGDDTTRWWFQMFFIFIPIWGRFRFWLVFFTWVGSTTN